MKKGGIGAVLSGPTHTSQEELPQRAVPCKSACKVPSPFLFDVVPCGKTMGNRKDTFTY